MDLDHYAISVTKYLSKLVQRETKAKRSVGMINKQVMGSCEE